MNQVQEIANSLRQKILSGDLRGGARLREADLANRFGVSRTPIREALVSMEAEGLVLYTMNRGFSVRSFRVADLVEAYEMRALLEGHACRLIAERGLSPEIERGMLESITEIDAMLAASTGLSDAERQIWQQHNASYHRLLLSEIPNQFFSRSLDMVQRIPLVQHAFAFYHESDLLRFYNGHHRQILNAIVHRQGGRAEHLMREHIGHACETVAAQLRANGAG